MAEKISTFARRLREGLDMRQMTQAMLAEKSGISKSSISRYLKGDWEGKQDAVYALAHVLQVEESWLMGYDVPAVPGTKIPDNAIPVGPGHQIPVLGSVRCGQPMYAEGNIDGYVPFLGNSGETYFALRAVGDSMNAAGINEGDLVIVRQQDSVDPNTIAVVCVNGDEATLKRFRQEGNTVFLMPQSTNPEHQVQVYDITKTPIHIIGRVMEIRKQL